MEAPLQNETNNTNNEVETPQNENNKQENENTSQEKDQEKTEDQLQTLEEKIDPIELKKQELKLLFDTAQSFMDDMQYNNAIEKYNTLLNDTENKSLLEDLKIEKINLLTNISKCFYKQRKFLESSKILYEIIINHDSKHLDSYYLLLKILLEIKEFSKAELLYNKINKIFSPKEIENYENLSEISEKIENNKKKIDITYKRQFYYNAEKKVIKILTNEYLILIIYFFIALFFGNLLSKLFI